MVDPVHTAALSFDYDTTGRARRVARSVGQEIGEIGGDRTRATLDRDGTTVRVGVEAADLVALRAGINTWTTLIEVAEAVDGVDSTA